MPPKGSGGAAGKGKGPDGMALVMAAVRYLPMHAARHIFARVSKTLSNCHVFEVPNTRAPVSNARAPVKGAPGNVQCTAHCTHRMPGRIGREKDGNMIEFGAWIVASLHNELLIQYCRPLWFWRLPVCNMRVLDEVLCAEKGGGGKGRQY